jgi:hypothetical protein
MKLISLSAILSTALIAISMPQNTEAFWGPPNKLTCKFDKFEDTTYHKSPKLDDAKRTSYPTWHWNIQVYKDSISMSTTKDGETSRVNIQKAIVNNDWIKFDWGNENYSKEITINRATNKMESYSELEVVSLTIGKGTGSCEKA